MCFYELVLFIGTVLQIVCVIIIVSCNLVRPVPTVSPAHDRTVTVGHNVTFNCQANGFELFYNWIFHPQSFICSGDCRLEGEHESQLTISNVPYSESPVTVICVIFDPETMTSHKLCTALHIDGQRS